MPICGICRNDHVWDLMDESYALICGDCAHKRKDLIINSEGQYALKATCVCGKVGPVNNVTNETPYYYCGCLASQR